jgi:hypothetical protein
MTTQTTTTPATDVAAAGATEDDFASVFAEITKEEDGKPAGKPAPVAPAADAGADQGAGASGAADAAGDAGSADAADAGAAAGDAAADASGEGKPATDDAAAQLAAAQARIAELEAAVKPKEEPKQDAPAAADTPAAEPEIKWYAASDEEKAVLDNFKKEWPEVDAAMQAQIRAAVYNTVQYTYAQIAKQYGPQLARFGEVADEVEEFMALQELRGANNDYDTIRDKVVQWVDTLPGFQKRAAQMTLKEGTPEEVNELIAEYKKIAPAPKAVGTAAGTPAAPAAKSKTELSAAAKKAARTLSVVDSKRTSETTAAVDPNDFDGAWREATAG